MSGEAHLEALLDVIVTSARQAIAEYKRSGDDVPTIHSKTFHPMDLATDNVALGKAVRLLEGACQQLCVSLALPRHAFHRSVAPFEWACMRVVVRAKVTDVLEKYPEGLHVDQLSELVSLEKGKLARVLRFLASKGCFTEVQRNTFSNNRTSLFTLSSTNSGAYSRMMVDDLSEGTPVLYDTMVDPEYATSHEPEKAPIIYALHKSLGFKGNYFDLLKQNEERRETFHRAMVGASKNSHPVLHYYLWDKVKTVCDVGAGVGAISQPLSKLYPHLKITHQDLPEVIAQAKSAWAENVPEALQHNRVEFIPFDFFEQSPSQGKDVYYLRQILHDWPDSEAAIILSNVRKAMAPHSRLLIHERVLPPCRRDPIAISFGLHDTPEPLLPNIGNISFAVDMNMWILFNSKERTLNEFIAMGSLEGLELEKVYDLAETAVLEFKVAA